MDGDQQESANAVASEAQITKSDNQDLPLDPKPMFKQPESRSKTNERLVAEVKRIFASLVNSEKECREIAALEAWVASKAASEMVICEDISAQEPLEPGDSGKDAANSAGGTVALTKKIGNEYRVLVGGQWIPSRSEELYADLLVSHRKLLDEYYNFLFKSQHPSASPALHRLARKYCMPTRMWTHGIHGLLEILRNRLPESQEFLDNFIILVYRELSLLEETVTQLQFTWVHCKGDLARYGMATQSDDMAARQRWMEISMEQYTRVLDEDPTNGRIYHHRGVLERLLSWSSPDAVDAIVCKLFYYTKSLVVKTPFLAAQEALLMVIDRIVSQNKEGADTDNFLAAVAHLILACLEPETLRTHGHKDNKSDHLQAVHAALEKIKIGGRAETSQIRPSAELGLLLCQLLLGIPLADNRWSPMMVAWAPDFITAEDRHDPHAMANARDIHNATIELIRTMIFYLLEKANPLDIRVWQFIYVLLVFMRSLKTRPDLVEWFGTAFHAELLAPFLNMLLREDETRGGLAFKSATQSKLVTICSLLNEREKPGKYGFSTEDILRSHREHEQQRKAARAKSTSTVGEATANGAKDTTTPTPEESTVTADDNTVTTGESTVTTEDTTTSDAARDRDIETPAAERMYANVLPEHYLLAGLFFAREAEDTAVVIDPLAPTLATEAEVRRQEGLLRDPPLFPKDWLKNSKHDYQERQVCNYVQPAEMQQERSLQILCLAAQLEGVFFTRKIDDEGRLWISVPGASSIPKPDPNNNKMPEIIELDSGVRVVYVHPSFHAAEIERERERQRKSMARKEKERDAGPDATTATVPTEDAAMDPGAMVRLTDGALHALPPMEDTAQVIECWGAGMKANGARENGEDS
ncbi:hypothetical protein CLAIMM_12093 [Cladophialophora immunda]|nr:hypothetical protein CLAIMM_12093 [Cladophialophora immunda]